MVEVLRWFPKTKKKCSIMSFLFYIEMQEEIPFPKNDYGTITSCRSCPTPQQTSLTWPNARPRVASPAHSP
jgi:hypothetical protein